MSDYRTTIHSNQFIVASVDRATGNFSMATKPAIHKDYQTGLHEAQRLANLQPAKKFVVLAVTAVAALREPVEVPVVLSYAL